MHSSPPDPPCPPRRTGDRGSRGLTPGKGYVSTGSPALTVRAATPADLRQTSNWQRTHLRAGLFPRLGGRFVRRWHATYLTSPFGIALVAEVDQAGHRVPAGYLLGSSDESQHVAHVLGHRKLPLALSGVTAMLGRPTVARDFLRTRGSAYVRRMYGAGQPPSNLAKVDAPPSEVGACVAVLTSLVVDPARRSCGVGSLLVHAYLTAAAAARSTDGGGDHPGRPRRSRGVLRVAGLGASANLHFQGRHPRRRI